MFDQPALEYHLVSDETLTRRLTWGAVRALAGSAIVLLPVSLVLALLLWALDPVLAGIVLLIVGLSFALLVVTFLQQRRFVRKGYAPGTTSTARYDVVARFSDGVREQQLPYPVLHSARQVGQVVVLRIRDGQAFVLPVELCPPPAQQRIAAGIASGWAPQPELSGFPHESRIDAEAARAIVGAAIRMTLLMPSMLVGAGFAVAASALAFVFGGPVWGSVVSVALLLVLTVPMLVVRARSVRVLSGEVVRSRFDAHDFTLYERGAITRRPYTDAESFRIAGGVALLRYRGMPLTEVLPAELFPAEVRDRFAAASAPVS